MWNSMSFKKILKLKWTIFFSITNSKHLQLLPSLHFNKVLEFTIFFETFLLITQKTHKSIYGKIISESNEYLAPLKDGTLASPRMYEWTNPSTYVAQGIPSTCQMVKPSQNFISDLIALGSPSTSLCWTMNFMFLLLKWVYFWCQRSRLFNPTSRPSCVVFVVDQVLKFNL